MSARAFEGGKNCDPSLKRPVHILAIVRGINVAIHIFSIFLSIFFESVLIFVRI